MKHAKNLKNTFVESSLLKEVGLLLVTILFVVTMSLYLVSAAPQGATIQGGVSVDSGPNRTPGSQTHQGGKIITMVLNLEQQDSAWKAYIGNVTGMYVLQNVNNQSIYEWPISLVQGEVYISRNALVSFANIRCANTTVISTENSFFGFSGSDDDAINKTFNATAHRTFAVGNVTIGPNNCSSTALWVNDTAQVQSSSAIWQEVLLDDTSNLVYTALMNNDRSGFDNFTYDFHAVIAENRTGPGTQYYFYVELG